MTRLPNLRRIRAHLRQGGVIAYATESCFGLGCDPGNARAVQRILALKGRPRSKGLILIGSDAAQFLRYLAPMADGLRDRLHEWWPGPNTLLLRASPHCPRWLTGRHNQLAVRVTAHPDAARLCAGLNMVLVSTSANRSGKQALRTAAACRKTFGLQVMVIPGRIGRRKTPSRILDPLSGRVARP